MTVYLVGAGPGDPGLITVRGAELLAGADVVVHDRLSARELLDLAPGAQSASTWEVARRAVGPPGAHQRAARRRPRRPAGRPAQAVTHVFAGKRRRGLEAAGVDYEVVPGITSAVAVPHARHPGHDAVLLDEPDRRHRPRGPLEVPHRRRLGVPRPRRRHDRHPHGRRQPRPHHRAAARRGPPARHTRCGHPVGHPTRAAHGAGHPRHAPPARPRAALHDRRGRGRTPPARLVRAPPPVRSAGGRDPRGAAGLGAVPAAAGGRRRGRRGAGDPHRGPRGRRLRCATLARSPGSTGRRPRRTGAAALRASRRSDLAGVQLAGRAGHRRRARRARPVADLVRRRRSPVAARRSLRPAGGQVLLVRAVARRPAGRVAAGRLGGRGRRRLPQRARRARRQGPGGSPVPRW